MKAAELASGSARSSVSSNPCTMLIRGSIPPSPTNHAGLYANFQGTLGFPRLAQPHVERPAAAVPQAGRRIAENDGAQFGLLQPFRHAATQNAAPRAAEAAREMVAGIHLAALAGDDQEHAMAL